MNLIPSRSAALRRGLWATFAGCLAAGGVAVVISAPGAGADGGSGGVAATAVTCPAVMASDCCDALGRPITPKHTRIQNDAINGRLRI